MKNEKPIFSHIIFSNYFDILDDEEITAKDVVDFTKALRAFCNGDFEYKIKNRIVRGYMSKIRKEMEARHKAYFRKLEALRKNSQKGGEANKRRLQALSNGEGPQSGENTKPLTLPKGKGPQSEKAMHTPTLTKGKNEKSITIPNCNSGKDDFCSETKTAGGFPFQRKGDFSKKEKLDNITPSPSADLIAKGSQKGAIWEPFGSFWLSLDSIFMNFKLSPHPPEAGGLDWAGVEFLKNFKAFGAAFALDMPKGLEDAQSDLLRWHCSASDGAEILSAAKKLGEDSGGDSRALSAAISELCQKMQSASGHNPMPRQMWKLFAKIVGLFESPAAQRLGGPLAIALAFAAEVSRAYGGEGASLWPILQEKADFAAQNKVSNLGAFLRARKTFGNG